MEEGDPIVPIQGEIDSNFAGIESERKKQLRNKLIMWGAVGLGVLIIIIIIIILALNGGSNDKDKEKEGGGSDDPDEDNVPEEIFGDIICIYEVSSGEINILSDEFDYQNNLRIYLGKNKIKFSKKYNFDILDPNGIRFEIHTKEFSLKNMFKNVENLKSVYFESKQGGKIISMESAFEGCKKLDGYHFNLGFDTSQLTSMKKAFASCQQLKDSQFYNMS